jgi:flagellar hook assembly protein FlgD
VKANLPDGWQLAWSADDKTGTIRVVALGSTPISYEGEIARLVFQLNDETAAISMTGEAFVNENAVTQLGDVNVVEVPTEFALGDNYPNPFNPTTTFTYSLPEASHVTIHVYDVTGRLVQTLVDGQKDAGRYDVKWDGQNSAGSLVASGLYLYRIEASTFTQVKTMMLVK